jgi:DEAD/DEAH box helicase domain-containing protein
MIGDADGVGRVLEVLRPTRAGGDAGDGSGGPLVFATLLPARPAEHATLDPPLPPPLQRHLDRAGIRLYRHQVEAIQVVRGGGNVVVSTPTASGKTLAFNLPVFERLAADLDATALYVYPMKALANDQLATLRALEQATGLRFAAAAYDGDTPQSARPRIRNQSRLVVTNPYGLHQYLPHHQLWTRFFSNLAVVVIDEAHWYRGVFGSNVALVLRRLRRILDHYGADPQFMLASGTIANPAEHSERLVGKSYEVIAADSAAHGPKHFLVWDTTRRPGRSAHQQVADLLALHAKQGCQTICFTVSRQMAELTARWAAEQAPGRRIVPYRAGYRPEDRRRIEQALKDGTVNGVASTNALELGIDIGGLDAAILASYPGTMMSTWQQAGRAGRGTATALVTLVAFEGPLDQYLARHPGELLSKPHEHAVVDLDNPYILNGHVLCAAAELPISGRDEAFFGPKLPDALAHWERKGRLARTSAGWIHRGRGRPVAEVSLDAIDAGLVEVRCDDANGDANHSSHGRLLEVLSQRRAYASAHPGAILYHQGESYRILRLDLAGGVATAQRVKTVDYTEPINQPSIAVTAERRRRPLNGARGRGVGSTLSVGTVEVTDEFVGYRRKHYDRVVQTHDLDLPPVQFATVGVWCAVSRRIRDAVRAAGRDWLGGLHAAEHAMIHLLPLFAMCDKRDLGGMSTAAHPDVGGGAVIFIYDGYPGGIGIAEKAFEVFEQLTAATCEMVRDCACEDGCPSCVYDRQCGNDNQLMDKQAALLILDRLTR